MKTTIYIVVRNTEDSEFNQISSFQSAHLTRNEAEIAVEKLREIYTHEPNFEILERIAE
jgi:hypothetical protein